MKRKFLSTGLLVGLLVASLAGLAGSNANASIARSAVLGTQPVFSSVSVGGFNLSSNAVNGALWYDDDYNVFYNPAYVNDNRNYVTIQKGLEGGWFKSEFENFAYGVYLNRGGTAQATYGGGQFIAPGFSPNSNFRGNQTALATQRPIDFFFGGDTGVRWGLHVAWAYNRNQLAGSNPNNGDAEITSRYWHFDLGATLMGFEPFAGATMLTKYQSSVDMPTMSTTAADLDEFNAGFRYKYEGWTPYLVFKKFRQSGLPTGVEGVTPMQKQTRFNIWGLGIGHDTKVADGVHVYKNVGLWMNSAQDDTGIAAATIAGQAGPDTHKDYKQYIVPINVALEAEATSWLTLRAGGTYDFFNWKKHASTNTTENPSPEALTEKSVSQPGATTFRIGSTFKFGKLHVDSAFGTGDPANAANNTTPDPDKQTIGFDSQTFALVSASYYW